MIFKKKNSKPKKIKVDNIYFVSNKNLKIHRKDGSIMPGGHDVIVTSINKSNNTARVKTITSLEHEAKGKYKFDFKSLNKAKDGEILPIPIKEIKSKHYSGINHDSKVVSLSKIDKSKSKYRFPRRYKDLIHKK